MPQAVGGIRVEAEKGCRDPAFALALAALREPGEEDGLVEDGGGPGACYTSGPFIPDRRVRSGLITFANPVVAIALGAVFLDELITVATVIGFLLVIAGCWLATRPAALVGRFARRVTRVEQPLDRYADAELSSWCPGNTSVSDLCHTGESPAVSTLKP